MVNEWESGTVWFSGLLDENFAPDGQGGIAPDAYATTPTDEAYRYVTQTQAPLSASNEYAAALMAGSQWSSVDASTAKTIVTYSFASPATSQYAYDTMTDFQATLGAFSEADRQLTRDLLARIEAVCNVEFVEVADNATECGVLRYGYSQQPNTMSFAGYAFFPSSEAMGGDVWIGAAQARPEWDFYRGALILHETLHALGLKHPFDANGAVLATELNAIPNTVMSYSPIAGTTSGYLSRYPAEPMALDIATLQYLYGAADTNAGNTVYDLAGTQFQSGFHAVWDAGGSDVFDASRIAHGVALDLAGNSDVGLSISATGYGNASGTLRTTYTATVSIAGGAVIENAVGSAYDDSLAGNAIGNQLLAGQGNDRLEGRGGNDILEGDGGVDTAVFDGLRSDYSVRRTSTGFEVAGGATGSDMLLGIERLAFADAQVALDLDGHAGTVARILGVVFGPDSLGNESYVGLGLRLADAGTSDEALMQLALGARLGADAGNAAVATLLLTNLTGLAPEADTLAAYTAWLDTGTGSQAQLGLMAAQSALNATHIDLVGLAASGLAFAL